MYRIMIVDDEPIVLDSLKTYPWQQYNCQVVLWADSGDMVLDHLEKKQPDILISDIRMPGLNGLELAKKIKQCRPDTEIILLTGFAEFEYAKQAISLGVHQYLLKPFRFEDITAALKSCMGVLEKRERQRSQQKQIQTQLETIYPLLTEQVYQDLLEGRIGNYSEKVTACNISEAAYVVFSTQCDTPGSPLDIALYAQLKEFLSGLEQEIYLAQGIDIISCIMCFHPHHPDSFCEQAALHLCEMIQESVMNKLGLEISFGISLPSRDIFMLHQLKKQSVRALNFRNSLGSRSLMLFSDIQKTTGHGIFNMTMYEKKIQKCIVQNQENELKSICEIMMNELIETANGDFSYIKKTLINLVVLTCRFVENYTSKSSRDYSQIEELFRCESIEKLSQNTVSLLLALTSPSPTSFSDGIADRIIDYMQQHLDQNITLDLLSQTMNYSTAYLSRLIKKNTGQSFSDLLQDMRLKKSQELLQQTDDRISDIAAKTGYNDVSYFIANFKKKTGVTPKEWRSLSKLGML